MISKFRFNSYSQYNVTLWTFGRIQKVYVRCIHTIFFGMQPIGVPHLGNYFGAIKKLVDLQNGRKQCIVSIDDIHSLPMSQDRGKLKFNIHLMAACLLACGINPNSSILFLQSQVSQRALLEWILLCRKTVPSKTQCKNKPASIDEKQDEFSNPILQTADILLYKATHVPVEKDRIQLTQDLARKFNNLYEEIFPIPEALIDERCAHIKGLRQPDKKMSRSDKNFKNRIELTDSTDVMRKRIKESLTDFTSAVTFDMERRPGVSNLILIHSLCSGKSPEEICRESESLDTGQYKLVVADVVIGYLKPIRDQIERLMSDPGYLERILTDGSDKASEIACRTLKEVKSAVGLSVKGCSRT